ncbi:MAG: hypothetical protein QHJ73_08065 [Armatimonadota bacterium]|nr:hypothetical protein [Armatimonadota bacterium]
MASTSPSTTSGAPQRTGPRPARGGITWRGVILGALLIPPNCYWIFMVEGIWHSGHPTAISLMWNTVFNLLVLLALNAWIRQRWPRHALTQGEFITVYVMIAIPSALAGHDSLQLGIPALTYGFWFQTPENKWSELFLQYMPRWLTVSDPEALKHLYTGHSTLYTAAHLRAWAAPVFWWTLFILALGTVMVSINVILRKQWTSYEKLSFPIIQLPLQMTQNGGATPFWRNRLLWIGFAAGAGLDLMNGLHVIFPTLPYLAVRHNEREFGRYWFTTSPWNAVGSMWFPLYPFIIALGFLLPLDLSFSTWFFYLFRKLQQVATRALAYDTLPKLPYLNEQSYGAWFVIFAMSMYMARGHLGEVWRHVITGRSRLQDRDEPFGYRTAAALLVSASAFLFLFCLRAGMTPSVIFWFFVIYFVIAVTITRVRAELGPPAHELVGMNAPNLMIDAVGTQAIAPQNHAMFALFYWFTGRGYRTQVMPHQMEALKMAEMARLSARKLGVAMMVSLLLGGISCFWACLHQHYQEGINMMTMHNGGTFTMTASRLQTPIPPDRTAIYFVGIGAAFTFFLAWMRTLFPWWPFHPAGYALSMNFGVDYFWSCILIAWLLKALVFRVGGYRLYLQAVVFMFGVILGEYSVGAFWSAASVVLRAQLYDFSPG